LDPAQRFYGIEIPAEHRNPEFPVSIEAIASRYIEEIKTVQPDGPYLLGGYSAGVPVALEMAQQLERRGQSVELLVSFDGAPLNSRASTSRWSPSYYGKMARNLPNWVADSLCANFSWGGLARRGSDKVHGVAKKVAARLAGNADFAKYDVRGFIAGYEFSAPALAFMEAFYAAVQHYIPSEYQGRVLLYQSRTEPLYHLLEVDRVWHKLASNLEVVRVKSAHASLLHEGRVLPIAEHLNERLRVCRMRSK
jgi:thioesterase domain-containing protein